MAPADRLIIARDRVAAAPSGSAAWKLGVHVKPYVWRRDDPDRAAKIAAEYVLSARQQRAAAASAAVRRMNVAPGSPLVPHPGATLPKGSPPSWDCSAEP
jgi:hypothetical protein